MPKQAQKTTATLIVSIAVALAGASAQSAAQSAKIVLDYTSQTNCVFQTNNGVSVKGVDPAEMTATGAFQSGCPTNGTPPANVELSATPATINLHEDVNVSWSATADVCRFDGSQLPENVPGWMPAGDACVGQSQCASGNSFSATLDTPGSYAFHLTCTSGANQEQGATSDSKTVVVDVEDGTPPGTCVAPNGMTRLLAGKISLPSGAQAYYNVDMTKWTEVFGWNYSDPPHTDHYTWPGLAQNSIKFHIPETNYVALKFTVPNDYPLLDGQGLEPSGSMLTNGSWATSGPWTVSITEDCGDFTQSAQGSRDFYCHRAFTSGTGAMAWAVLDPADQPSMWLCPLERGHTYYLNITFAPLGDPTDQGSCPGNLCKFNLSNGGSIEGTYEQIP